VIYRNHFLLVQHEILVVANLAVKLYYEEILNEKLGSPCSLHALMDKQMDQV
jgi:hypothetical protein